MGFFLIRTVLESEGDGINGYQPRRRFEVVGEDDGVAGGII